MGFSSFFCSTSLIKLSMSLRLSLVASANICIICSRNAPWGRAASKGVASLMSALRPSAEFKSLRLDNSLIKKADRGIARFISVSKAALPWARIKLSGSCSAGKKRKLIRLSSAAKGNAASKARHAARRPALSPSKL